MQKKTSKEKGVSVTLHGTSALKDTSNGVRKKSHGKRTSVPFTAEELRRISEEISLRELPAPASSRLVLMEIDPWNVHAYWHIRASDMAKCRARLTGNGLNSRLVLRFHDVSSKQDQNGLHERFDIEVAEDSNNWYVNLWRDGKHYSAEIGLRTDDGSFESLVTSNQVATPRAYPSADLDFYLVNVHAPTIPEAATRIIPRAINDDLLRDLFPQRLLSGGEFPWIDQNEFSPSHDDVAFPDLDETEPENVDESRDFPVLDRRELEKYGTLTSKSREKLLAGTQLPVLDALPAGMVAPAGIQFDIHPSAVPLVSLLEESARRRKAEPVNFSREYPYESGITDLQKGQHRHRFVALEMHIGNSDSSSSTADDTYKIETNLVIEGICPPDSHLLFFGEHVNAEPDGKFCIKLPLERSPELLEFMYRVSSRKIKE